MVKIVSPWLTLVASFLETPHMENCCNCTCAKENHSVQKSTMIKVKEIINGRFSDLDRRRAFARLRNKGIIVQNSELCLAGKSDFSVIKKTAKDTEVVHCRNYNGSYSKKYFYRHRRQCHPAASLLNVKKHPQLIDILGDFQQTPVGNICRQDITLHAIGMHLWLKDRAKVDKHDEECHGGYEDTSISFLAFPAART